MLGLENYLQSYLKDKNLINKYLKQINTPMLIEILKILNGELKLRITEFKEKK